MKKEPLTRIARSLIPTILLAFIAVSWNNQVLYPIYGTHILYCGLQQ